MSNFNTCISNLMLIIMIAATSLPEAIALRQAEVLVSESAFISCSSNEVSSIQWHHTPPGKSSEYVYAGGSFKSSYRDGRFRVDNNSTTNMYTLIIANVIQEDAGLYECQDDVNSGVFGSTYLTVLDSSPVCTSNMNSNGFAGPNTCKEIEQENMTFSCAVSFSGNSPTLKWSTLNGNQVLKSSICERKDNRINCSLSMKADPSFDGSTFICQTTSNDARHNCSIKDIRVEYFFGDYEVAEKRVGDNVTCMVASNLQIHYNWTKQQNNEDNIFSANRMIFFQKPGFYKCSVKYNIRDVTCYAPIVAVIVSNIVDINVSTEQSNGLAIGVSIGVFMCLIAVIAFLLYRKFIKGLSVSCLHLLGKDDTKNQTPEILELIAGLTSGSSDEPNLSSKMEAQKKKLQDIIAPVFGLTDELCSSNVLTSHQKRLIEDKETIDDQNELLLEFILKSGKCEEFVQALQESGQTHVANWIEGNGVYKPEFGKEWPLREKELGFLRSNLEKLIDELDTKHGFLDHLLSKKVINVRQMEYIKKKSAKFDCNEAFLEILMQSSVEAYNLAIICLRESGQETVSKLFEEGRAILPIHTTLEGNNIDEVEEHIVNEMKKWCLENKPFLEDIDEDRLLARLCPMIIAVKKDKSILT